ncbi:hypothetical protein [Peribacillus sp. NJ4]|uniref:hypothetical protein n=1 Tax=Peribacillus sp. NJ4 TaxID=3055862 RepID=UPI0025A1F6FB|nr:hypothetical protein [Peribacillus sp. NJ4]
MGLLKKIIALFHLSIFQHCLHPVIFNYLQTIFKLTYTKDHTGWEIVQALVVRRLGSQSEEREWISEINWNVY